MGLGYQTQERTEEVCTIAEIEPSAMASKSLEKGGSNPILVIPWVAF
jgi:hypothetical protein